MKTFIKVTATILAVTLAVAIIGAAILAALALLFAPGLLAITAVEADGVPTEEWLPYAKMWAILSTPHIIFFGVLLVKDFLQEERFSTYHKLGLIAIALIILLASLGLGLESACLLFLASMAYAGLIGNYLFHQEEKQKNN